jgi:hypothetical protein
MGRIKLTRRVDAHGNSVAVFSKGAGSFSVRVVEAEGSGSVTTTEADSKVRPLVKRTTLAEFLNRPDEN